MAVQILIDTSNLRKDPYFEKTKEGKWLMTLGLHNKIKIHLHYIIENELLTQMEEISLAPSLRDLERSISVFRKGPALTSDENFLKMLEGKVKDFKDGFYEKFKSVYEQPFVIKVNGMKNHVESVFSDYFKGTSNFKTIKSRNDIPDSFIYRHIHEFSGENKIISVINDTKLREICAELKNVTCYGDLESLMADPMLVGLVKNYGNQVTQKKKEELLLSYVNADNLFNDDRPFEINEYLSKILEGECFGAEELHSLSDEATFETIYSYDLESAVRINYVPENGVSVQFRASLNADVSYEASDRAIASIEEYTTSYHEVSHDRILVSEEVYVTCDFNILINFPIDFWDKFLRHISFDSENDNIEDIEVDYDAEDFLGDLFNKDEVQLSKFQVSSVERIKREVESNGYAEYCTVCHALVGSCEH